MRVQAVEEALDVLVRIEVLESLFLLDLILVQLPFVLDGLQLADAVIDSYSSM